MRSIEAFTYFQKPADVVATSPRTETKEIPWETLEYLGGYFDMAGIFTLHSHQDIIETGGEMGFGCDFRMDLARVHQKPIVLMKQTFPASESSHKTAEKGTLIPRWYATNERAAEVFDHIAPILRLKAGHIPLIREFLDHTEEISLHRLKEIKREWSDLRKNPKPDFSQSFSDPYLAGVIDAHCYMQLLPGRKKLRLEIKITPGNTEFATEIMREYSDLDPAEHVGTLKRGFVVFKNKHAHEILKRVRPYLLVYADLADAGMKFQEVQEKSADEFGGKIEKEEAEQAAVLRFHEEFEKIRRKPGRLRKAA